ncbi:hypothetical protein V5O48_014959 [Marasmius crinis-equi]|uniref:Uncharacterized protein n=1 Tax=Marasmius crinis-equi TaxID=585013 RepID=A0ABR3EVV0_9AGAR
MDVRANLFLTRRILVCTWPTCSSHTWDPQFSLNLDAGNVGSQSPRINEILSVLPLADLRKLGYQFAPDDSASDLIERFQALPSLHTIRVFDGIHFEETVYALSRVRVPQKSSSETLSNPESSVVFPALSHVELIDFNFGSEGRASQDWPLGLWPNQFADALKGRSGCGAPLPTVMLQDCEGLEDEHIKELKRMNVKVEVK